MKWMVEAKTCLFFFLKTKLITDIVTPLRHLSKFLKEKNFGCHHCYWQVKKLYTHLAANFYCTEFWQDGKQKYKELPNLNQNVVGCFFVSTSKRNSSEQKWGDTFLQTPQTYSKVAGKKNPKPVGQNFFFFL